MSDPLTAAREALAAIEAMPKDWRMTLKESSLMGPRTHEELATVRAGMAAILDSFRHLRAALTEVDRIHDLYRRVPGSSARLAIVLCERIAAGESPESVAADYDGLDAGELRTMVAKVRGGDPRCKAKV